jgi:hypothetical protein
MGKKNNLIDIALTIMLYVVCITGVITGSYSSYLIFFVYAEEASEQLSLAQKIIIWDLPFLFIAALFVVLLPKKKCSDDEDEFV